MNQMGIEASWAGGVDGREVIDEFVPQAAQALSATGSLYLLLEDLNKPAEVIDKLTDLGLQSEVVLTRKARNEKLHIIRFFR
mmetsp:Transcript_29342/g.62578  ORF Transcript_29342/g.62578 Transcript_29342/m.62578 type:complete len:82 (+) Transcript_29342:42-287(+)